MLERSEGRMSTWPLDKCMTPDCYVTADSIRAPIQDACPEMARALRPAAATGELFDRA